MDGQLLYSQAEVDTIKNDLNNTSMTNQARAVNRAHLEIRDNIIKFFQGQVINGDFNNDEATDLFNNMADELGWEQVNSIRTLWQVAVHYQGNELITFNDVEAFDSSEAEELVENELEISDLDVSFDIKYGDQSSYVSATITADNHTLVEDLTFHASEQE